MRHATASLAVRAAHHAGSGALPFSGLDLVLVVAAAGLLLMLGAGLAGVSRRS